MPVQMSKNRVPNPPWTDAKKHFNHNKRGQPQQCLVCLRKSNDSQTSLFNVIVYRFDSHIFDKKRIFGEIIEVTDGHID